MRQHAEPRTRREAYLRPRNVATAPTLLLMSSVDLTVMDLATADLATWTRTTVEYLYTTVSTTGTGAAYSYTTVPVSPNRNGQYVTTTTSYFTVKPNGRFRAAHTRQLVAAAICLVFALALLVLLVSTCVRQDKLRPKPPPPPPPIPMVTQPAARNTRYDVAPVVREPSPDAPPPYAP